MGFLENLRKEMGFLGAILKHPEEIYPLIRMAIAVKFPAKVIPRPPHWAFCYSFFPNIFTSSFIAPILQLDTELRDVIVILSLVFRALDNIEDDTSIPTDVKVQALNTFHSHIDDPQWHFPCGDDRYKLLMDEFHHLSTAFLELDESFQKVIKEATREMGAGMAKFITNEVKTIADFDEYCYYVGGLVGISVTKIFNLDTPPTENIANSMCLFLQKADAILDYLEDINQMPKPRMLWPREIWSKYVNKLEDLKFEENSDKALQCLNEMVTNALMHVEDCFKYLSALHDPAQFRMWAMMQICEMGTLALCYNNIELFRGPVKLRRGIKARIFYQTRSMSDVYRSFYEFSCQMKSKVDKNDPNATETLNRLEAIQNACRESGLINKRLLWSLLLCPLCWSAFSAKEQVIKRFSLPLACGWTSG